MILDRHPRLPEIPRAMSQSATKLPPVEAVASTDSAASKKRVLVVDDFDDAREMYAEYLEFAGFQVETARNGQEAVEKA
jgi:PleD family two-component response regulator